MLEHVSEHMWAHRHIQKFYTFRKEEWLRNYLSIWKLDVFSKEWCYHLEPRNSPTWPLTLCTQCLPTVTGLQDILKTRRSCWLPPCMATKTLRRQHLFFFFFWLSTRMTWCYCYKHRMYLEWIPRGFTGKSASPWEEGEFLQRRRLIGIHIQIVISSGIGGGTSGLQGVGE